MRADAIIQARVDKKTKKLAQDVLSALNMTLSEAVVIYLKQIIYHRGIPFDLKIPNAATRKALRDVKKGRGLHTVADTDKLLKELNR